MQHYGTRGTSGYVAPLTASDLGRFRATPINNYQCSVNKSEHSTSNYKNDNYGYNRNYSQARDVGKAGENLSASTKFFDSSKRTAEKPSKYAVPVHARPSSRYQAKTKSKKDEEEYSKFVKLNDRHNEIGTKNLTISALAAKYLTQQEPHARGNSSSRCTTPTFSTPYSSSVNRTTFADSIRNATTAASDSSPFLKITRSQSRDSLLSNNSYSHYSSPGFGYTVTKAHQSTVAPDAISSCRTRSRHSSPIGSRNGSVTPKSTSYLTDLSREYEKIKHKYTQNVSSMTTQRHSDSLNLTPKQGSNGFKQNSESSRQSDGFNRSYVHKPTNSDLAMSLTTNGQKAGESSWAKHYTHLSTKWAENTGSTLHISKDQYSYRPSTLNDQMQLSEAIFGKSRFEKIKEIGGNSRYANYSTKKNTKFHDYSEDGYDDGLSSDGTILSRASNLSKNGRRRRNASRRSASCYGQRSENRRDFSSRSRDGISTDDEDSESMSASGSVESRMKMRRRRLRKSKTLLQVSKEDGWTNRMAIQAAKTVQNYKDRLVNKEVLPKYSNTWINSLKPTKISDYMGQKENISMKHKGNSVSSRRQLKLDQKQAAGLSVSESLNITETPHIRSNNFDYTTYQKEIAPRVIKSLSTHEDPVLALLEIDKELLPKSCQKREDQVELSTPEKHLNSDSLQNLGENSATESLEQSREIKTFKFAETGANISVIRERMDSVSALICLSDSQVEKVQNIQNVKTAEKINLFQKEKLKRHVPVAKPRRSLENSKRSDQKSINSKMILVSSKNANNSNVKNFPLINELLCAKNELATLKQHVKTGEQHIKIIKIAEPVLKRPLVLSTSSKKSEQAKPTSVNVKKSKEASLISPKSENPTTLVKISQKNPKIVQPTNNNANASKNKTLVPPKILPQRQDNGKKYAEKSKQIDGDKLKNAPKLVKTRNESTCGAIEANKSRRLSISNDNKQDTEKLQYAAVSGAKKLPENPKIKSDKEKTTKLNSAQLMAKNKDDRALKAEKKNFAQQVEPIRPIKSTDEKRIITNKNSEPPKDRGAESDVDLTDNNRSNKMTDVVMISNEINKISPDGDIEQFLRLDMEPCFSGYKGQVLPEHIKPDRKSVLSAEASSFSGWSDQLKSLNWYQTKSLSRSHTTEQKARNQLTPTNVNLNNLLMKREPSTFSLHSLPSVDREMLQLLTLGEELSHSIHSHHSYEENTAGQNANLCLVSPLDPQLKINTVKNTLAETEPMNTDVSPPSIAKNNEEMWSDSEAYSFVTASNRPLRGNKVLDLDNSIDLSYKQATSNLPSENLASLRPVRTFTGQGLMKGHSFSDRLTLKTDNDSFAKTLVTCENSSNDNSTMESSYKKAIRIMNESSISSLGSHNSSFIDKNLRARISESPAHRGGSSLEQATTKIDQMLRLARNKHKQEKMQLQQAADELEQVYEQMSQQLTKSLQSGLEKSTSLKLKSEQKFIPVSERVKQLDQIKQTNQIKDKPKALELNFEKLRSHSFNSRDDLHRSQYESAQGIVYSGNTNKFDYTKKWLEGNLKSLINDPKPDLLQFDSQIRIEADQGSVGSASAEVAAITNRERLHALKVPDIVPHKMRIIKPAPLNLPAILLPSTSFDVSSSEKTGQIQWKIYENEFDRTDSSNNHSDKTMPKFIKALSEINDRDRNLFMARNQHDSILNVAIKDTGLVKKQVDLFDRMSDNESERSYISDQLCYKKLLASSSNIERITLNNKVAGVIRKFESEELLPSNKWASIEREQAKLERCVRGIKNVCKLQAKTVSLSRNGSTHSLPVLQSSSVRSGFLGGMRASGMNAENSDFFTKSINSSCTTIQNDPATNIELLTPKIPEHSSSLSIENILADLNIDPNRYTHDYANNRTRFPSEIRRISPSRQGLNVIPEYSEHYENITYANDNMLESFHTSLPRHAPEGSVGYPSLKHQTHGFKQKPVLHLENDTQTLDSLVGPPVLPLRHITLKPPEPFYAQGFPKPYKNRNSWHEPPFQVRLQLDPNHSEPETIDLYESIIHLNQSTSDTIPKIKPKMEEQTPTFSQTSVIAKGHNNAFSPDDNNGIGKHRMRNLLHIFKSNKQNEGRIYNITSINENISSADFNAPVKPRSVHKSLSENHTRSIAYQGAETCIKVDQEAMPAYNVSNGADQEKPKKFRFGSWNFLKR